MPRFFVRLVESVETLVRLASSRLSYVAALESFHRERRNPAPPREPAFVFGNATNEQALVSLIILSLHGAEMLRTLFTSIARYNTWTDIELLVVDHGGDEETADVIREARRHLNVRHLKPGRNFSFAFSCNRAAQVAQGDVVVFLNNDIEFTEDILPRIVAASRSGDNLAGVKFWNIPSDGRAAEKPQTGIRFRWNERQGWTVPYEVVPDDLFPDGPREVPAITAAVLGVSRQKFLDIGGFHENYLYAYEDVDLCLKAAMRFGMKSISLNDMSVRHLWGATRFKRSPRKRRRDWHRYNMSVFRSRCGYLSRRMAWLGLFDKSGFDWGRGPAISIIEGERGGTQASEGRAHIFGSETVSADCAGYNLYGYDVVVCRSPQVEPGVMRHLGPMTLRVAWISGSDQDWMPVADFYDLFVAETEDAAAATTKKMGLPVHCSGEAGAADLYAILTDFVETRFRMIVIASPDNEDAAALVTRLRGEGHSVHARCGIESRDALRYDAAIWFEPAFEKPAAGTIHVAAHDVLEGQEGFYEICSGSRRGGFDLWFDDLMNGVIDCHERLMAGPEDPPLDDKVDFDDAKAETFWSSYEDPTAGLIGQLPRA
ncbi:glycosyltransferase family 2 protein [Parvibaculum sp.]|jgi:GT2 family glycosyltransferase|uniref:glycosyltransferase family 2 protein n=1 Tax=Parvibaculum sp. TaxID=2024848 RepID=UPI002FD95BA1